MYQIYMINVINIVSSDLQNAYKSIFMSPKITKI